MAVAVEAKFNSIVCNSFALHPLAYARFCEQIDRPLFENACANPFLGIVTAAILDHKGLDACQIQQMGEHKPGRTGSDNANLSAVGPGHLRAHCLVQSVDALRSI